MSACTGHFLLCAKARAKGSLAYAREKLIWSRARWSRALLLLASGGDPRRDLDPESRAVDSLAGDLDAPGRRSALLASLQDLRGGADGLSAVSAALDALLADLELAWRWAACGLLAEELEAE